MTINIVKLVIVGVLAVLIIVAIGLDWVEQDWGSLFLGTLIGYVVGNAAVTSQTGGTAPVVKRLPPPE